MTHEQALKSAKRRYLVERDPESRMAQLRYRPPYGKFIYWMADGTYSAMKAMERRMVKAMARYLTELSANPRCSE